MVYGAYEPCGCVPAATDEEVVHIERWLSGQEVEGFPVHSNSLFIGHRADEDFLPTDSKSLEAYRKRERLKPE